MSELVVHELGLNSGGDFPQDVLKQPFTVGNQNLNVANVTVHIYRHNSPAGTVRLQLLDTNSRLIDESTPVTISTIGSDNFFHGLFTFVFDIGLKANRNYILAMASAGGYVFAEGAYVGWVTDFGNVTKKHPFSPNKDFSSPMDLKFWIKVKNQKGQE